MRFTIQKKLFGGKSKKHKGKKNKRRSTKKILRKGHAGPVAGERRNDTRRVVTRRLGRVLQKRKECLRNLVETLYKLGKAQIMTNGLLQRIEMVRQQGKYVPSTTEEWQRVIDLKASKYRFENPDMNLLEEEINPVDGFLPQLVNTEMRQFEGEQVVLDRIERNIDAQNYINVVLDFNRVLTNFALDPTYLYQDLQDDPVVYVREDSFPFIQNERNALGNELVKPVLIKGRIDKTKITKLVVVMNKVREINGLLESGQYENAKAKARSLVVIYCKQFFINLIKILLRIYEDQFISLIPFLPNYMFRHYEAKVSHDAGIEYDTVEPDPDRENIIVDDGNWSDMDETDEEYIEDMGETDGEETEEALVVGGPHPEDPVPDDF